MSEWISIKTRLPETEFEVDQFDDDDYVGCVSNSLEITDGYNYARGHYREDGRWIIYEAEHDFQIVEPSEITHYAPLPKLPNKA